MKKKLTFFIALALLTLHCVAQQHKGEIKVYKQNRIGLISASYLILKPNHSFDMCRFNYVIIGDYKQSGDTITLTPKYNYRHDSSIKNIGSDVTFASIPLVFIQKGKRLMDITPYTKYPELAPFFTDDNARYRFHQIL